MTTTPPPLTTQAHVEPFLAYLRSTYPDYFTSSERPSRVVDDFLTHAPERARQRSYSVTNAVKRDRDDQLPRRARRGGDAVDADALCKELDSLRTSEDVQRFVNKLLGERHEKPIHPTTHAAAATREGGVTDITGEALGEDGNDGNPPAQPTSPEVSMVAGSARRTARTSTARRRTQRKRRCWTLVGGGQRQSGNSRQSSARTAPRRKKRQKRVWRWV